MLKDQGTELLELIIRLKEMESLCLALTATFPTSLTASKLMRIMELVSPLIMVTVKTMDVIKIVMMGTVMAPMDILSLISHF